MEKNNFYYFKRAFLMSIFIAIFIIVRDLFNIDLSESSEIMKTALKGIFVGLIMGAIFGIVNIFTKY